MKQFDNISKALTAFSLAAATQVAALEGLLSDSNVGVRMSAAYGLLPTSPKIAVPVLKEISQREDIHSLTAKATLEQWEQNTLMYPF